jgi:hypothetical protein
MDDWEADRVAGTVEDTGIARGHVQLKAAGGTGYALVVEVG